MRLKLDGEEFESDFSIFAVDGIWIWKNDDWEQQIPYMDRKDFCEKAKEQFKKHPNYLDLDELFTHP